MNDFVKLTDSNYVLYCAKHYDNRLCVDENEFFEDLKHVKYIKKLFTRYETLGDLKERLILNHIIILNNLFTPEHVIRMLFLKIPEKHWPYLKPFLIFLDMLIPVVDNIGNKGECIRTDLIVMDYLIIERLRQI